MYPGVRHSFCGIRLGLPYLNHPGWGRFCFWVDICVRLVFLLYSLGVIQSGGLGEHTHSVV